MGKEVNIQELYRSACEAVGALTVECNLLRSYAADLERQVADLNGTDETAADAAA